MLKHTATATLTEQLCNRFAERIRTRLLAPGARLPSVRQCAQQQGVSPSTVVAAYDQLMARGLIEARPQRGFYVRQSLSSEKLNQKSKFSDNQYHDLDIQNIADSNQNTSVSSVKISKNESVQDPNPHVPINATALIRGMFRGQPGPVAKPQPGLGVFPPDWLQNSFLGAAVRKASSGGMLESTSLHYGDPMGDASLRQALSHKLAGLQIDAAPTQILTTMGATHALDIVSRTLLRAGDAVMVEEPGWAIEYARLAAMGLLILPVPRGPDGPDLAVMAQYCALHQPKLFVSVSVLHNPTGYCLSPGAAHRVLQLAHAQGFHIVEDDTYSHLAAEHATRLSALDGLRRTVYVSGFSKIIAPGWRVGYMAAPPDLVERLTDTKLLATLTTPPILEKAMAWCIDQGQLRRHAARIRTRLDAARTRSVNLAQQAGCTFAAPPAGLFGWVDTGVDTEALAQ
ncbi:MAG: hypothetical protein RLZZ126_2007, partial [Pseudomonadota bacterium]